MTLCVLNNKYFSANRLTKPFAFDIMYIENPKGDCQYGK